MLSASAAPGNVTGQMPIDFSFRQFGVNWTQPRGAASGRLVIFVKAVANDGQLEICGARQATGLIGVELTSYFMSTVSPSL